MLLNGEDNQSRFQVIHSAGLLALPAKCAVCGGVNKEFYVDFGLQIEFFGAIYFCNECMNAAGARVGLVPEAQVFTLEKSLGELMETVQARVAVFKDLAAEINAAVTNGINRATALDFTITDCSVADTSDSEVTRENNDNAIGAAADAGESPSKSRTTRVSSDPSNDGKSAFAGIN